MLKAKIKSVNQNTIYLDIEGKTFPSIKANGKEFRFWSGLVAPPRITLKKAPRFRNPKKFERWIRNHLPKRRLERFLTGVLGQKVVIDIDN